ncbi:MAG: efflux RND transporter periplasmic adaptor subunit [Polyangiaceae bacterium]
MRVLLLVMLLLLSGCREQRSDEVAPAERPAENGSASSEIATGKCEHGLPDALCPKCHPQLAAVYKAKGNWCGDHGFPESFCPICHPGKPAPDVSASAPSDDWCVEHAVPESKCTRCSPNLVAKFKAAGDWCGEHGFPESVCPKCNPQAPPPGAEVRAIEARTVKLRDPKHESVAGIRAVVAREVAVGDYVECHGQIAYNQDRLADVRALVPGVVRRVRVKLGEQIKRGTPLFDVQSSEVGQAQGALIRARGRVKASKANLARQQNLQLQDIASERDVELAEQELAAAKAEERTALVTLRMTGASGTSGSGHYTLSAPLAGTVVARKGVVGLLATDETPLATVADISSMWVLCEVPEVDAGAVALGQKVLVSPGGGAAEVGGEVSWIASEVDPRTRMVTLRASVPNPDHTLRANQFVAAKVEVKGRRAAVAVPRAAVQRVGARDVVFVRTSEALFAPRVVVRLTSGETVQVEGRVKPGDLVVTDGAILLRTEIMPGSLGAGCCEVASASEK